jgi:hypothetical protein
MSDLLTLEQAAKKFHYTNPESFRQAVRRNGWPVIKAGKRLLFDYKELLTYLKKAHNTNAKTRKGGKQEESLCHSNRGTASGTLASPHQTESAYGNLLKLKTSN